MGSDVDHGHRGPLAVAEPFVVGFIVEVAVGLSATTADPWAHDERLPTSSHFLANPSPRAGQPRRLLTGRDNRGRDR